MIPFQLNFIDHVAIRVQDINRSAAWYEKVLGFKRGHFPEWGDHPVFMLSARSGIAIFPATGDTGINKEKKMVKIDHFAFNVSSEDLEKAKQYYQSTGQPFKFQDHMYSHSIYLNDPDGHVVELTAICNADIFYGQ